MQQSLAAARRVFEVLDTPVEVQSRPDAIKPARLTGRMVFEKVTFGYHDDKPVLTDVSFEAKPGQVIGIFGMTGTGKSSLLGLIPRFYDPFAGGFWWTERICGNWTWTPTGGRSGLSIRRVFCFRTRCRRTSRSGIRTRRWNKSSTRRGLPRRTSSSRAAARLRNGAGGIRRGFVGRTAAAAGVGAGVVAATASPDPRRPDGVGGCADGK